MALLSSTTVLSIFLTLLLLLNIPSSSASSGHDGITAAKPSGADSGLTQSTQPRYSVPRRLFGIRAPPSNKPTRYSLSSEPSPSAETHAATDHGAKPSWAMPPPPPKADHGATPLWAIAVPPPPPKTTDQGATPFWKIPPPLPKMNHGSRHFWAKTNAPRVPVTPLKKTQKARPDNPIPPPSGAPPQYPRRL